MPDTKTLIQNQLAESLVKWNQDTRLIEKSSAVALHHLDLSNDSTGLNDLFFGGNGASDTNGHIKLHNQDVISSNALRNCFYPALHKQHTSINKVSVRTTFTGHMRFSIFQASEGSEPKLLSEQTLYAPDTGAPKTVEIKVPSFSRAKENTRLYWEILSYSDQTELLEATWITKAPAQTNGKMLICIRTYGRTQDIADLFETFKAEMPLQDYKQFLANCFFLILDTSPGVSAQDYAELLGEQDFNSFVFCGANMGGGGNMSQMLLLLDEAVSQSQIEIAELLLLDDDLLISLESLYRHWAACLFRTDDTIFTLPVFTKSEPRRMWEDGAFWGRFTDQHTPEKRSTLSPKLLRHNLTFKADHHLNELAEPHYPEYSTFIFQSLPFNHFKKLGFPVAFFLRGDDIEYSLRHKKAGHKTLSNPNLTAWHEPAHSYAQEYMSIAHGLIINISYGQETRDLFVAFFLERARAHAAIGDVLGLGLYTKILIDINSCAVFLEHDFTAHYLKALGHFKAFDQQYESVPASVLNEMSHGPSRDRASIKTFNFIYMPCAETSNNDCIVLNNPHTNLKLVYRNTPERDIQVASAAAELYSAIGIFASQFEKLATHYQERLADTSQKAFWQQEITAHQDQLLTIGESHTAALPALQPATDVKEPFLSHFKSAPKSAFKDLRQIGPEDLYKSRKFSSYSAITLQSIALSTFLDGVVDDRRLTLAQSTSAPFFGTSWTLLPAGNATWIIANQNNQDYCLGNNGHPDSDLELMPHRASIQSSPTQWLIFEFKGALLIRHISGQWLKTQDDSAGLGELTEPGTNDYHWIINSPQNG